MKNLGAEHENLDYQAYQVLKTMIIDRTLLPGDKIYQEKVARELGISRTPVISALKYLEQEKLVEARPRRGFFVRLFSRQEMVSIFELREVLEGLAARRAARHITATQARKVQGFFTSFQNPERINDYKAYSREDRRFHNFVIEIGAQEFLKSILENTNIISYSYQVVSSEGLLRPPAETLKEHLAIIEAICNRDGTGAETVMRRHLKNTITVLKQEIGTQTQAA